MSRLLVPSEIKYLSKFILDHFNFIEFQSFLIQRSDIDYFNHMPVIGGFDTGVPLFIHQMSKNYKIHSILLALESKFPEEAKIKQLLLDIGVSYQLYNEKPEQLIADTAALQSWLNQEQWFDTDTFFNLLGARKRCVCRVEVINELGKDIPGTGFLIGPNQVMTNYHVIHPIIDKPELLKKVVFRFDFEAQSDAIELNSGSVFSIDQNKPIEIYSQYCQYDLIGEPNLSLECDPDKLDFAILNLTDNVGNMPFGIRAEHALTGINRGWIKLLKPNNNQMAQNGSLIIIQHPEGGPLKMAIGLNKIMAVSPNRRRVRYNINTSKGSSGSPVFNTDFELVALHNMGDIRYIPKFNQGIVMDRIIEFLNSNNYVIQI